VRAQAGGTRCKCRAESWTRPDREGRRQHCLLTAAARVRASAAAHRSRDGLKNGAAVPRCAGGAGARRSLQVPWVLWSHSGGRQRLGHSMGS
jgi:hypothetical protein